MTSSEALKSRKAWALGQGVLVFGVSLLLAGCGGGETTSAPVPPTPPRPGADHCPGSTHEQPVTCTSAQCCPGFEGSGGKTFPCPSMRPENYTDCEGGEKELVDALLFSLTRLEKYKFLRGVGWENSWDPHKGYFIGNAAIGLPFGIPSQNMMDNGNGFRNNYMTRESAGIEGGFPMEREQVTSFPVSLAIASIWSEEDMSRFGNMLGKEFRAKGSNVLLGPAVNVHRVPRNGRNAEYMSGESPYLGARLIKPYIRGVQSQGVLCSVKHFINNNQESCRRSSDSVVDDRTRWQVYYPPFEAAVQADVAVQMCGYNYVNGEPNCGSKDILIRDLKERLNFSGWVQSDWWATYSFDVVNAGIDQEMPGTAAPTDDPTYQPWFSDENLNTLSDAKVDSMVRPQLTYMARYGLFVPGDTTCQAAGGCNHLYYNNDVRTNESEDLAKELATKAVTLLRNEIVDGTTRALPLQKTEDILVVGKACDLQTDIEEEVRVWTLSNYYHIGGSGKVITKQPITIVKALQDACAGEACTVRNISQDDAAAVLAEFNTKAPDVVIICGGVTSTENSDREHLKIDQQEFVENVTRDLSSVKRKVVFTMTAGTIVMPWIDQVDAMVNVFLPGKFAGSAFSDVLFGTSNPSAKTPIFYPKDAADTIDPCPCNDNIIDICNYTERLNIAWYGMDQSKILYPFGFGLSYTTYQYSNAEQHTGEAAKQNCPAQDADKGSAIVCITADVQNTGARDGSEIAQLYLGFPSDAGEPPKLLRGFHRVSVTAGQTVKARFPLYERDFQIYDADQAEWTRPATNQFTVYVGADANDETLQLTLQPPNFVKEYI